MEKMYLSSEALEVMEKLGIKCLVLSRILKLMDPDRNVLNYNGSQLSAEIEISRPTVSATINELVAAGFMRKMGTRRYMINPNIVVSGSTHRSQTYLKNEWNKLKK